MCKSEQLKFLKYLITISNVITQLLQLSLKNEHNSARNSLDIFFRKTLFNGTHQRVVTRNRVYH